MQPDEYMSPNASLSPTHQYAESLEVIDGAGQNHRGVPKVSLKIGIRGAVGQQQLQGAQMTKKKKE